MKKKLSILLALIMMLSCGSLMTSCKKDDGREETKKERKKKNKDDDDDDDDDDDGESKFNLGSKETDGKDIDGSTDATSLPGGDLSKDPARETTSLGGPVVSIGPHEIPDYYYEKVNVDPQTIWNQDGLVITVTGYVLGAGTERTFTMTVDNQTGHKVKLTSELFVIDGYEELNFYSEEFENGTTTESSFYYFATLGGNIGLWNPGKIDWVFNVTNMDDNTTFVTPRLSFFTSAYVEGFFVDVYSYGVEVYNDGIIRITAFHYEPSGHGTDAGLRFLVENYSDQEIVVITDQVLVNGFPCELYLYADVQPWDKAVKEMSFSKTKLQEIGIGSVTDVSFILEIYPFSDYQNVTYTDPITITVG